MFYCINYNSFVPLLTFIPAELHRFKKLVRRKIKQQDPPNNYRPSSYLISLSWVYWLPELFPVLPLGFLRTPVRTGITLLTRLPCCSFLPDFIEQTKLRKFIIQPCEAPHIFLFYFFGHFTGEGVCFANLFNYSRDRFAAGFFSIRKP